MTSPWTQVVPNLSFGTDSHSPHGFDAVVSLGERGAKIPDGVRHMVATGLSLDSLYSVAEWAFRKWRDGQNVLIRCGNGKDRSGLLATMVLVKMGARPDEAIKLVRCSRPGAASDTFMQAVAA